MLSAGHLTIGEALVVLRGHNHERRERARMSLANAWYAAALARTEHMPALSKLLGTEPPTPEDLEAMAARHDELVRAVSDDGR